LPVVNSFGVNNFLLVWS